MVIHFRNKCAIGYKGVILKQFKRLVSFFSFEPGDIFIEILAIEDFDKLYELEYGCKPFPFVVGAALSNGRIIVLEKKDFPKKQSHYEEEFEAVILHEMAHIFIRRLLWPKTTYVWIEEGICEFLSFGNIPLKNLKLVDLKEIKDEEGWDKHCPYQQSRAFFDYLSKKYGNKAVVSFIKKIKEKEEEESFKEVFGKELDVVEENFKTTLKNENI